MALAPSFGPASSDCRRDVLWKREPLDGAAPASTPGSACEVRRSAVPVRAPEPATLPDSGFRPAPSSSPYLLRQDRHTQTTRVTRTFQYVFVLTAPPPFPSPKPANQLRPSYRRVAGALEAWAQSARAGSKPAASWMCTRDKCRESE